MRSVCFSVVCLLMLVGLWDLWFGVGFYCWCCGFNCCLWVSFVVLMVVGCG